MLLSPLAPTWIEVGRLIWRNYWHNLWKIQKYWHQSIISTISSLRQWLHCTIQYYLLCKFTALRFLSWYTSPHFNILYKSFFSLELIERDVRKYTVFGHGTIAHFVCFSFGITTVMWATSTSTCASTVSITYFNDFSVGSTTDGFSLTKLRLPVTQPITINVSTQ